MTFRNFEIFVAVCDAMNMTAAAERLYVSQSAVSQAVSELEKYYGTRLFERLSRKLYLTSAGEKLYGYARHIIGMGEEIDREMKALGGGGAIRVGASVTVATNILPALVSSFKQTAPDTEITVFEDNTDEIERRLLSDEADIGLVEGEIRSPNILGAPFADDEMTLICGTGHRFAAMRTVAPRELESEDFIVREPGSGTRKTFEDAMAGKGLTWKAAWVCTSSDTIKEAVMAGLGVSVLSGIAVEREIAAGKLCAKPVTGIRFRRTFKIARHKNKYLTPAMEKFMDFCSSYSFCTNSAL